MFTIVVLDGEKVERKEFLTTCYQAPNMEYSEVVLVPGKV